MFTFEGVVGERVELLGEGFCGFRLGQKWLSKSGQHSKWKLRALCWTLRVWQKGGLDGQQNKKWSWSNLFVEYNLIPTQAFCRAPNDQNWQRQKKKQTNTNSKAKLPINSAGALQILHAWNHNRLQRRSALRAYIAPSLRESKASTDSPALASLRPMLTLTSRSGAITDQSAARIAWPS